MSVIFGTVFAALPSISPHVLLGIRLSLLLVMGVLIRNLWVLHKELREIQKHRRERYKHIREYNQMLGVPLQSLTGNLSNRRRRHEDSNRRHAVSAYNTTFGSIRCPRPR